MIEIDIYIEQLHLYLEWSGGLFSSNGASIPQSDCYELFKFWYKG